MQQQVEDVERANQRALDEHLQFLPYMRFRHERCEAERQCGEQEEDEGLAIDPVHR